jgi:hypothetical protein
MLKHLALLLLSLAIVPSARAAQPQGDCSGTPSTAAMELPRPLSEWAAIVCTPYGHIISNHEGWIWSRPGGYVPVFVPSQMVRNNPEAVGNASYFTSIDFKELPLSEPGAVKALAALEADLPAEPASKAYRLAVSGSLGRSLVLYFFQLDTSIWGIWCGKDGDACTSDSKFMLLDMRDGS